MEEIINKLKKQINEGYACKDSLQITSWGNQHIVLISVIDAEKILDFLLKNIEPLTTSDLKLEIEDLRKKLFKSESSLKSLINNGCQSYDLFSKDDIPTIVDLIKEINDYRQQIKDLEKLL